MRIITFEEVVRPDERALVFAPIDESTRGKMSAENALAYHQARIEKADLVANVPEPVRRNFERFRMVHTYGVVLYDLFTIVDDFSVFALEQALGHRLLEHYQGELPLVDSNDEVQPLRAEWFEQVHQQMRDRNGHYYRRHWRLPGTSSEDDFRFTGTLTNLLAWARWRGYLRGQRNRQVENALVNRRNRAAHPTGHHLVAPVDSAPTIRDLAEIINHLWGATTPEGRLYPPPIQRDVIAIWWAETESSLSMTLASNLSEAYDDQASYMLVRGVFHDGGLFEFSTDFATTTFPSEWLWGPGSLHDALGWLRDEQPSPDLVDPLDQPFLVEIKEGRAQRPRRPDVAASLVGKSESDWHLLLADFPRAAFHHVRTVLSDPNHATDVCPACSTETITVGRLCEVLEAVEGRYGAVDAASLKGIEVPKRW